MGQFRDITKGWECAKQIPLREEINILVLGTDNSGRTACHWAAEKGKSEKLTKENFKNNVLLVTDDEGWTAWYRATYVGNLDVLQNY
jgi:ankyrin repeat protein